MSETRLVTPRTDIELPPSTDPLGEVLQLLQLTGVLYCSAELTDPWGIEIPELEGVMNVNVVTSGHCWIELEGQAPVFMPEGSMALIPRGRRHKIRGNPGDRTTWPWPRKWEITARWSWGAAPVSRVFSVRKRQWLTVP